MHILRLVQHSAAALVVDLARFGQGQAAGAAVEQLNLQLIFQSGDDLADGGDAHLELSGSSGKGA